MTDSATEAQPVAEALRELRREVALQREALAALLRVAAAGAGDRIDVAALADAVARAVEPPGRMQLRALAENVTAIAGRIASLEETVAQQRLGFDGVAERTAKLVDEVAALPHMEQLLLIRSQIRNGLDETRRLVDEKVRAMSETVRSAAADPSGLDHRFAALDTAIGAVGTDLAVRVDGLVSEGSQRILAEIPERLRAALDEAAEPLLERLLQGGREQLQPLVLAVQQQQERAAEALALLDRLPAQLERLVASLAEPMLERLTQAAADRLRPLVLAAEQQHERIAKVAASLAELPVQFERAGAALWEQNAVSLEAGLETGLDAVRARLSEALDRQALHLTEAHQRIEESVSGTVQRAVESLGEELRRAGAEQGRALDGRTAEVAEAIREVTERTAGREELTSRLRDLASSLGARFVAELQPLVSSVPELQRRIAAIENHLMSGRPADERSERRSVRLWGRKSRNGEEEMFAAMRGTPAREQPRVQLLALGSDLRAEPPRSPLPPDIATGGPEADSRGVRPESSDWLAEPGTDDELEFLSLRPTLERHHDSPATPQEPGELAVRPREATGRPRPDGPQPGIALSTPARRTPPSKVAQGRAPRKRAAAAQLREGGKAASSAKAAPSAKAVQPKKTAASRATASSRKAASSRRTASSRTATVTTRRTVRAQPKPVTPKGAKGTSGPTSAPAARATTRKTTGRLEPLPSAPTEAAERAAPRGGRGRGPDAGGVPSAVSRSRPKATERSLRRSKSAPQAPKR